MSGFAYSASKRDGTDWKPFHHDRQFFSSMLFLVAIYLLVFFTALLSTPSVPGIKI
jgi:hypothetical protein